MVSVKGQSQEKHQMAFALRLRFNARFVSMINILKQLIMYIYNKIWRKSIKRTFSKGILGIFKFLTCFLSAIKLFLWLLFLTFCRATQETLKLSQVSSLKRRSNEGIFRILFLFFLFIRFFIALRALERNHIRIL